ncbi:MAG: NUDIX domain-containing protein, partial [Pseudonocardia sp.]|nr:NUDIX domain-containing protein [Pseudonocardia sp.]
MHDPGAEPVARYDAAGHPTGGVEERRIVYRDGLWHAGTGVLLRSGDGARIYVHRRTDTKLVHPGAWDCWAGGVIEPGEPPAIAAARELGEELGVHDVPLTPLGRFAYDDGLLRYHVFTFEAFRDGPVTWQPEEVAEGGWVTVAELRALLSDPARPFAPDGRLGAERWLA